MMIIRTLIARLRRDQPRTATDAVADLKRLALAAVAQGLNHTVTGRPRWTVETFDIMCSTGVEPARGLVQGYFAVHPGPFAWTLTHLPTGLALAPGACIELLDLAELLRPLSLWSGTTVAAVRAHPDDPRAKAILCAWLDARAQRTPG